MTDDENYPPIWDVKRRYPIGIQVRAVDTAFTEYQDQVGELLKIDEDDPDTPYAVLFPDHAPSDYHWIANVEPIAPPPPTFTTQEEADEWLKRS